MIYVGRKIYHGLLGTGNDALYLLTKNRPYALRVDLMDFQNNSAYAIYSNFSVADSNNFYKLSLGTYSGTAGTVITFLLAVINKGYSNN